MKVLIDPGHAPGNANGGVNGYKEYAGMWKLSNFLKDILAFHGVTAALTRSEKQDPSLEARGGMAKGYDFFISQHSNAFNGTVRGCECFYSVKKPNDRVIAAKLSAVVAKQMNNPDRGAKTREGNGGDDYYGVIRTAVAAGCPCVFLMESGFHDNWLDEEFLLKEINLKNIATVQAKVILEALGVGDVPGNSSPSQPNAKTPIMGVPVITAEQLAAFLISKNPEPKINCTALELARFFITEGNIEGVRGDIAFCQSILETGWFKYGGQVLPEQNNYAGIGAVNNSPVGAGAWFDSPLIGVRAQIHHLKAYASTEPPKQPNASPRAHLVTKGIAPCWEDLNGRWAVPGTTYGQSILKLFEQATDFVSKQPPVPAEMDLTAALDILVEHGVINSPDYWIANHNRLKYVDRLIINMALKLTK
ncbi:MAG: N-acetylmuramoyl-L-alanine amidase [Defluviitaleaceae bacterium]|nr:N-acetylmuramoyl-L-alanine amidase [Defluviitaleaceae bacterium]